MPRWFPRQWPATGEATPQIALEFHLSGKQIVEIFRQEAVLRNFPPTNEHADRPLKRGRRGELRIPEIRRIERDVVGIHREAIGLQAMARNGYTGDPSKLL